LRVLALALLLSGLGCERPVPAERIGEQLAALDRPNLVLILVDTLRADWTTPYGSEHDTTPELQRWAERGVVFERTRAQSSWTKISMASLLTSLWPRSHAIREPNDGLSSDAVTLAEVLQGAGYRTYGVQTNGWLDQSFGFQQGFDHYVFPLAKGAKRMPRASVWPHADRVLKESQRLLDAHDRDHPFFLYLHFMDVHEYAAPVEFRTFGDDTVGHYRAAIRWVDDAIQRVAEQLDDAGVLDDTVVVFAADHGETFGEHGVHGHARNVRTPVVWVPLLLRLPFATEPVRVGSQVRNIDIAPTLLALAGVDAPPSFEGESLLALLDAADAPSDRPSFAGLGFPLYLDSRIQSAVNDGHWNFVRNEENERQLGPAPPPELLFDRAVDPIEQVNLIDREPAEAARLRAILESHLEAKPSEGVRDSDVRIDPGIAERLRAMGYLQ
jgi:arylsulfatase A-like enzyme